MKKLLILLLVLGFMGCKEKKSEKVIINDRIEGEYFMTRTYWSYSQTIGGDGRELRSDCNVSIGGYKFKTSDIQDEVGEYIKIFDIWHTRNNVLFYRDLVADSLEERQKKIDTFLKEKQ